VAQSLGKIIGAARKRADLPASAVARRAELDPAYYARIENGRVPNPPFATVVKIAKALGLSLDELAGNAPEDAEARKRAGADLRRLRDLRAAAADLERAKVHIDRILES
jgi:transcriptional regulator with XRE-family HTH domain